MVNYITMRFISVKYFTKVNDAKLKQRVEFVQRLIDYYHNQVRLEKFFKIYLKFI